MRKLSYLLFIPLILVSCKNRDLNEGEEFRPRVLEDSFDDSHFTRVTVDGVEYLMLERDNNNPHEGFGFMAFRANTLLEKEDTVIAYLKSISDLQVQYFATLSRKSEQDVRDDFNMLFKKHLKEKQVELDHLELDSLTTSSKE